MKSGNLNFLEPSGPVQACNETDLRIWVTHRTIHMDFCPHHDLYTTTEYTDMSSWITLYTVKCNAA